MTSTLPPCKQITITLTGQPGIGWNFAVMRDGVPMPAEDPQDLPCAGRALQCALEQIEASFLPLEVGE